MLNNKLIKINTKNIVDIVNERRDADKEKKNIKLKEVLYNVSDCVDNFCNNYLQKINKSI